MAVETEIKLRLPPRQEGAWDGLTVLLEQQGFRAIGARQLETDQTFDLPASELRQSGRLLRLRSRDGRWTLTYKGPVDKTLVDSRKLKSREEIETDLSDGPAFEQILEALGYQRAFAYEKFRTTFKAPGEDGIVTLDETPMGNFLELEGPAYWIDRTALRLGFHSADYITSSYAALYEDYRRTLEATSGNPVPRDMQFYRP